MKYLMITASEVERMCDKLAEMIKGKFKPDCIVGIGRGGFIPSVYLSDRLGVKKLYAIKIEYYKNCTIGKKPIVRQRLPLSSIHGKVLLVDDIADSGKTLLLVKKILKGHAEEIKTATLHYKPFSKIKPDFFVHTTKQWVVYPYQTTEFNSHKADT